MTFFSSMCSILSGENNAGFLEIRPEFVASNLTEVLYDTGHKRAVTEQEDVLFNSIVFAKVLRAIPIQVEA